MNLRLDPTSAVSARVEAMLAVLEREDDPAERAQILVDVAIAIRDGMQDAAQALDALLQAWREDPTNPHFLDNVEPLARSQGRWPEIFEVTRALVAAERDPKRALAYSEAMVRWLTREVP